MAYSRQTQEQNQLEEQLTLARARLEKYPAPQKLASDKEEMEIRLVKAKADLSLAKVNLYHSIESIEASKALFDIADDSLVEITNIASPGISEEQVEQIIMSALPLTVTAEGDVPNLVNFVFNWIKEYPTGIVKSVEINVPEATEEGEEQKPSAVIDLIIYSYEGD